MIEVLKLPGYGPNVCDHTHTYTLYALSLLFRRWLVSVPGLIGGASVGVCVCVCVILTNSQKRLKWGPLHGEAMGGSSVFTNLT